MRGSLSNGAGSLFIARSVVINWTCLRCSAGQHVFGGLQEALKLTTAMTLSIMTNLAHSRFHSTLGWFTPGSSLLESTLFHLCCSRVDNLYRVKALVVSFQRIRELGSTVSTWCQFGKQGFSDPSWTFHSHRQSELFHCQLQQTSYSDRLTTYADVLLLFVACSQGTSAQECSIAYSSS